MARPKPLTKEQIQLAMRMTKSNKAAARYLNVSYIHYKGWAKQYVEFEGGRSLFEIHKNQSGKGIPKFWANHPDKKSQWDVLDIIEGRIASVHFRPEDIKKKMLEENYLKEECTICGFHDRRLTDYKMPLILDFKDNNPNHYNLGNIRFLCYNCYFINIGEVFNDKDIHQLETHTPVYGTSDAVEFELDDYQRQRLTELGLYEPPKPEDDGSEFISRI
jgi:hypothetical protein